jgi:hypothetical protein
MSFQIETEVTCYLLPGDGPTAEKEFLTNLNAGKETWFIAYAFTLVPMIDELLSAKAKGVALHLYLDHSQAVGHYEAGQIQRLVDAGVEVTVGTSPVGSQYICHTKGVAVDVDPPWCWEGSVNFSKQAWDQVNTAMVFESQEWRDQFVQQFMALRNFAWTNERSIQVMPSPPPCMDLAAPAGGQTEGAPSSAAPAPTHAGTKRSPKGHPRAAPAGAQAKGGPPSVSPTSKRRGSKPSSKGHTSAARRQRRKR